ncbi:hypothetical protein SERLA73DRAFT_141654 [Serpula lacrymans var. lacrymans S7.3]|uniref:HMG box domain-containing protein n=2 Tax=Serpula lacrymans var. lacrymans TaxID=341189 RepID=F8Q6R9_SERL3|nr:uncharacterized protein SERLADRAFT_397322 [Serpula lacrymans var. lacrymans S7.9]EGN96307.1 hypothetical protein SERLA73DRAFT_141654 [Serpula lacrymans var. lacrymans S7.3]EGO21843.1 hypothetical protein SERLADRAFT_397322 [Serpula lacrymans var. lacrymans S7.9]
MAPSSDRRAQRNRTRDPAWVPRPRNAFIIFRCEYSRDHQQSNQDVKQDEDSESRSPTAKTLSKRAAEAWKLLTASQKTRYKELADQEREEHARRHPNYRFRPMRRQNLSKSRQRCYGPQSNESSVERTEDRCSQVATLVMQGQTGPQLEESMRQWGCSESESSECPQTRSSSQQANEPATESEVVQRRPSSVPIRDSFPNQYITPTFSRDAFRRAKSAEGRVVDSSFQDSLDHLSQAAYDQSISDASLTYPYPATTPADLEDTPCVYDVFPFVNYNTDIGVPHYPNSTYLSPLEAVNYAATPALSHSSSQCSTISSSAGLSPAKQEVDEAGNSSSALLAALGDETQPAVTTSPHDLSISHLGGLALDLAGCYYDTEQAQALQSYSTGLHDFMIPTFPHYQDSLVGDNPFQIDFNQIL